MDPKVLKTSSEYEEALKAFDRLMERDPQPGSPDAERLELLTLLIQDYEERRFPFAAPDPVSAIEFRMEQAGLEPRDLIPYIGGRSKVSEVLSGKRALSLSMIRALSSGLGIPVEVLVQEPAHFEDEEDVDYSKFPIKEMVRRGWFEVTGTRDAPSAVRAYLGSIGWTRAEIAFYRSSAHFRSARKMDPYALAAWSAKVRQSCIERKLKNSFRPHTVDLGFMRSIAQISRSDDGPRQAKEALEEVGICLVVEPHLPKTYIDGAAIMVDKRRPIIGLTLRYDRLDNFWFTLMHELAHIALHLRSESDRYFDDLDFRGRVSEEEREADEMAGEALVAGAAWKTSAARHVPSPQAVNQLARTLHVHPSIVAGKVRYETGSYRILNQMVGHGEARRHFQEIDWENL